MCAVQGREEEKGGLPRPGADPPTHRKPFLRNTDDGWPGVPATEEALSSHQLR